MNTNELADYLDKYALARSVPEQKYIEQAATMLRQQQAENITEIKRTSDQSITIVFTSCRSASEFETILRKANEK